MDGFAHNPCYVKLHCTDGMDVWVHAVSPSLPPGIGPAVSSNELDQSCVSWLESAGVVIELS
jgi:hypothetical protein